MSTANPLWGAPRIHGELQKLGIAVSQSTVQVHASAPAAAVANVTHVSDESRDPDHGGRPIRRADHDVPAAVRTRHPGTRPSTHRSDTAAGDRKSTRLNSSHSQSSYAVFCLKKKKNEVEDAV